MRIALTLGLFLLAGGAAHAAVPASLHLLERDANASTHPQSLVFRMHLLAQSAEPDLTPPPLITAPGGTTPAPPSNGPKSSRPPSTYDIGTDPYAGTFVGKEVAMGALMTLGADVLLLGGGIAAAVAVLIAGNGNNSSVVTAVVLYLGAVLLDFVLSPLACGLGVFWSTDSQRNNGLFGALLGAYAAQGVVFLTSLAMSFVIYALSPTGTSGASGPANAISLVMAVIYLGLHYVGMPIASSMGLHWGGPVNKGNARRPELLPTTPSEVYASDRGTGSSPIFHVTF